MMSRVKGLLKREKDKERGRGKVVVLSKGVEKRGGRLDREGKGESPYLYSGSPSSSTAFIFPIKVVI